MHHPTHIRAVDPDDDGQTVKAIEQHVFRAHAMDKVEMLARILQAEGRGLTLVFCRTKRTAAKVADDLADRGFASGAVHGDLGQGAREQALRAFRSRQGRRARRHRRRRPRHRRRGHHPRRSTTSAPRTRRPTCTGSAAPPAPARPGIAVTFVDWDDIPRWMLIDKALDLGFGEPEETYSSSDHLYEELDIPRDVTGVLPRAQRTRAGLAAEKVEDLGETGRHGASPARGRGATGGTSRGASGGRGSSGGRRDSAEPAEAAERPPGPAAAGPGRGPAPGSPPTAPPRPACGPATATAADGDAPRRRAGAAAAAVAPGARRPVPAQPVPAAAAATDVPPTQAEACARNDDRERGPGRAAPLGGRRRSLAGPRPRAGRGRRRAAHLRCSEQVGRLLTGEPDVREHVGSRERSDEG